jgi:hypothetical protein
MPVDSPEGKMTRPASGLRASVDTPSAVAQRMYVRLLVVAVLTCAWLTLSAAILEVMTRTGGAP